CSFSRSVSCFRTISASAAPPELRNSARRSRTGREPVKTEPSRSTAIRSTERILERRMGKSRYSKEKPRQKCRKAHRAASLSFSVGSTYLALRPHWPPSNGLRRPSQAEAIHPWRASNPRHADDGPL